MKQNHGSTNGCFLNAMTAALEHQHNMHWHCGDWCTYVDIAEADWIAENEAENHRLHKKFDIALCKQASAIHFCHTKTLPCSIMNWIP